MDRLFTMEEARLFNKDNPFICTNCQILIKEKKKVLENKSQKKELKKITDQINELKQSQTQDKSEENILKLETLQKDLEAKEEEYQRLLKTLPFSKKEKITISLSNSLGIHWRKYLGLGVLGLFVSLGIVSKALLNPAVLRDLLIVTPALFVLWIIVSFTSKKKKLKST